ncbi:unnamed protein product [Moneuplotes crassus]|uniref:C2H2-type domain-containing protein n=1 Tax=Euplotes crassus TaxID=5936 RepID=A0AAD1Y3U1_EUPCR|nr:unnamed protein product [Moneuplotes crassus]
MDSKQCKKCSKIFKSFHMLEKHLVDEHCVTPKYVCDICFAPFFRHTAFYQHKWRHTHSPHHSPKPPTNPPLSTSTPPLYIPSFPCCPPKPSSRPRLKPHRPATPQPLSSSLETYLWLSGPEYCLNKVYMEMLECVKE